MFVLPQAHHIMQDCYVRLLILFHKSMLHLGSPYIDSANTLYSIITPGNTHNDIFFVFLRLFN